MKPGKHGGDRYQQGFVTEDEKTQIAELWNAGRSATEIAKAMRGRSRNSVSGIVVRMRDRGDARIVRGAQGSSPWSDAESLQLLALRENQQKPFHLIGQIMARFGGACRQHYYEILADMKRAGW